MHPCRQKAQHDGNADADEDGESDFSEEDEELRPSVHSITPLLLCYIETAEMPRKGLLFCWHLKYAVTCDFVVDDSLHLVKQL